MSAAAAATPINHILDNLDSCDAFFASQIGVIAADAMAQSQSALSMSVQLQLRNLGTIGAAQAATLQNRITASGFADSRKARLSAALAARVGTATPALQMRVQTLASGRCYPSCFAHRTAEVLFTCMV